MTYFLDAPPDVFTSGYAVFIPIHLVQLFNEIGIISRNAILNSIDSYEIIEQYPDDKYLPSFLIYAESNGEVIHIHVAVDQAENNVRIITSYRPTLDKWQSGFKMRRNS